MPYLDPLQNCLVILSVALAPSFVNAITYCAKTQERRKKVLSLNFVFAAVILFTVAIVTYQISKNIDKFVIVWSIIAILLLQFRFIEAYYRYPLCKEGREKLEKENKDMEYVLSNMASSALRIMVMIPLFYTFYCPNVGWIQTVYNEFVLSTKTPTKCTFSVMQNSTYGSAHNDTDCESKEKLYWSVFGPFLAHVVSSILASHCAVLACRLWIQIIGFAIPLITAAPTYVVFLVLFQFTDISRVIGNIGSIEMNTDFLLTLAFFILGWLGQIWLCQHIWKNGSEERLALINRFFVLPNFCSVTLDLSLLHSKKKKVTDNNEDKSTYEQKVYACATMWHESRAEMKQILLSIFRLDKEQKQLCKEDKYTFEAQIYFDDAMETVKKSDIDQNAEKKQRRDIDNYTHVRQPNEFVTQFMEMVKEAGNLFYKKNLKPSKCKSTPYGAQLVWKLPGGNKLLVHLKDKEKIRHKKRWSQIMYMYYIIGYELLGKYKEKLQDIEKKNDHSIFDGMDPDIVTKLENTYILALDGDVNFQPGALKYLIDRMKINGQVGATCGRIRPKGKGPVVWYQRFEYAVGHWLQKSSEHMFGCVLCSPGCFSLFRAKALLDNNVMKTYATVPTEAVHFLQYDQGEDRWLSTLLLQQGYKIEYCAAAEASTFAPEEFKEFFNQRKRWMPSTMANMLDLLKSFRRTTKINPNISNLYLFYQLFMLLSSVLGPSTVLLALQSAVMSVFNVTTLASYILTYGPPALFIFICLKFKTSTQLNFAVIFSTLYALLMMAVFVGTIMNIASEGWYTPTGVFFYILVGTFLVTGILHPLELGDLACGVLYLICIPAGYLFLVIYAICNLNNVSWGTRENKTAVVVQNTKRSRTKETGKNLKIVADDIIEIMLNQAKEAEFSKSSRAEAIFSTFRWINNLIILKSLQSVQSIFEKSNTSLTDAAKTIYKPSSAKQPINIQYINSRTTDNKLELADIKIEVKKLEDEEEAFWNEFIDQYVKPFDVSESRKKVDRENLDDLRNEVAFGIFFVNALWLAIITAMNDVRNIISISITQTSGPPIVIEPLEFAFLAIFALLLLLQFIGMLMHRYETFLHIMSNTSCVEINTRCKSNAKQNDIESHT